MAKKHVGTVCGHHQQILDDGDAYCVEFEDVQGDICIDCFTENTCIQNDCTDMGVNNPYKGNLTDYWYKGTLEQFKKEINQ